MGGDLIGWKDGSGAGLYKVKNEIDSPGSVRKIDNKLIVDGTAKVIQQNKSGIAQYTLPGTSFFSKNPRPNQQIGAINVNDSNSGLQRSKLQSINYKASPNSVNKRSEAFLDAQELSPSGKPDGKADTTAELNGSDYLNLTQHSGNSVISATGSNNTFDGTLKGGSIEVNGTSSFSDFKVNGEKVDFGGKENVRISWVDDE